MTSLLERCAVVAGVVLLAACGDGAPQQDVVVELPPPEVFTWATGQPVSFSPPPGDWKRSRYQNGGAEGADFVLAGSQGEQILLAERFFLGRRDHCAKLNEMLAELDGYDRSGFRGAVQKARLYAAEPFSDREEKLIAAANLSLDRAAEAFNRKDKAAARVELERALEQAGRIRFTVEESVDRVLFTRERNSVYPSLAVEEPVTGTVAGEPALIVAFTFDGHGTPMIGRRVYLVKNNRMFEFGFQGREENLALFERVLASVTFPAGTCVH